MTAVWGLGTITVLSTSVLGMDGSDLGQSVLQFLEHDTVTQEEHGLQQVVVGQQFVVDLLLQQSLQEFT